VRRGRRGVPGDHGTGGHGKQATPRQEASESFAGVAY